MNRIAAIDFGSNAVRFIIAEVTDEKDQLKVIKSLRESVRLGHDVFTTGLISAATEQKALAAFSMFQNLIKQYDVESVKAVATSATREAKNGKEFADRIHHTTGLRLTLIDGVEEAELVHLAVKHKLNLNDQNALLIDIGGGSVETSFTKSGVGGGSIRATRSFHLGAVRLIEELKKRNLSESETLSMLSELAEPLCQFLLHEKPSRSLDIAVGTGGNFEALGNLKLRVLGNSNNSHVSMEELDLIQKSLLSSNMEQRVQELGLKPDRADVVVPALAVMKKILLTVEMDTIHIPYVGLKEGLLWKALGELHG